VDELEKMQWRNRFVDQGQRTANGVSPS